MSNYLDFAIYFQLANGKPLSAKFLASKFEVCTKTIYRHVNNLIFAGLPIVTTSGKNGGIQLSGNTLFCPSLLTKEEIFYLHNLISSTTLTSNKILSQTIAAKLSNYLNSQNSEITK